MMIERADCNVIFDFCLLLCHASGERVADGLEKAATISVSGGRSRPMARVGDKQ